MGTVQQAEGPDFFGGFVLDGPALRPEQSRMARAALEWSLEDAAKAAGVSRRTVLRFERYHRDVRPELIAALRRAFEAAGVRFLDKGTDAGGVVPPPLRAPLPNKLAPQMVLERDHLSSPEARVGPILQTPSYLGRGRAHTCRARGSLGKSGGFCVSG
jgi:transcriptional regulator with XRE-family HTH domain